MYLTYETYQDLGGTLDETTFNEFEFEAECIVNWYTFNRLQKETNYPDALSRCMFALIKLAKARADAMMMGAQTVTTTDAEGHVTTVVTSPTISSQSNDGVSISYNAVPASEVFGNLSAQKKGGEIESLVQMYLNGVTNSLGHKLLYRGVYPDE